MSDEKFPLPGSSYKELSKIIDAYSNVNGATAPGPVAQLAVTHETVVSRNNKFLVATGVIEGGQKKTCTALGIRLGRAIQHEQQEAVSDAWRAVVQQTDFFQKVISAIRIRKGMEESALASHIAFTAGSAKNAYARAGAGAVIEILRLSGAIYADGGTLLASPVGESADLPDGPLLEDSLWNPSSHKEPSSTLLRSDSNVQKKEQPVKFYGGPVAPPPVTLEISLQIKCTVSELSELGPQLRKIRDAFEGVTNGVALNLQAATIDKAQTDANSGTEDTESEVAGE